MSIEAGIATHYAEGSLEQRILAALRQAGKDPERLDPDDLAPVDEFHAGGRAATAAFAPRLGLRGGARLLDIGSGLGGPARFLARQFGCRVAGIDLTEEFVVLARALTNRLGMQDQVEFEHGSALAMPFATASFDAATIFHVGMNIADKPALFAEVRRVLKPAGSFGIYDQMRAGEGELVFPVPWASDPQTSFVETAEAYKNWLSAAGFSIVWERSCGADALAAFNRQTAATPPGAAALPPLGVHVTMGRDAGQKIANLRRGLAAGIVVPYEIVARAPA